jgi:hypothetical protein
VALTVGTRAGLLPRTLIDEHLNPVQHREPRAHAPREQAEQQADPLGQVASLALAPDLAAPTLARRPMLGRRVHDVTVLSVIAFVQISWLSVLGYGLFLAFN